MSSALVVIRSTQDRDRIGKWAHQAPPGTRVEFKETKRTLPQNARFWAMLSDIAAQKEHFGRRYSTDVWKALMMHAWGREVKFIPALDGESVMPMMFSSSDLSKAEMSDLIEFMLSWGAQNGVVFRDSE